MSEPPPPPPPPSGPDVPPSPEPPPPEPGVCPRCGAPHDPYQEYCLECGHRLPSPYGMRTREIWSRDSPLWLWAARGDKEGQPKTSIPVVTTGPSTTDTVGVITQPPTTVTINPPTTTFGSTTTLSTTTTTTGNVTWPAGKDGYSIFLKSVPTSEGRAKADAAAQRARNNGLSQVGVLNSSDFSSLRPGYWVTFTGIYDTQQQANAALPNARARGFPTAYTRPVRD